MASLPPRQMRFAFSPELAVREDTAMLLNAVREEGFKQIELKGEDWERREIRHLVAETGLEVVHLDELFPPSLTRGVLGQAAGLRREFGHRLKEAMAAIGEAGISAFSLNFDLAEVMSSPPRLAALVELLREAAPELHRRDLRLLLPTRVPTAAPLPVAGRTWLMRQIMVPQVLLAFEIHPHECQRLKQTPAELIRDGRFQLALARMEYDAEAGNQLTSQLLEAWGQALGGAGKVTFCFRPHGETLERIFVELAALHRLLLRQGLP